MKSSKYNKEKDLTNEKPNSREKDEIKKTKDFKMCKGCNTNKSITEFYKNKARNDGLQTYCKPCMKKENVNNYKKHKDKWDLRTSKYGKTEENKKYRREWAKNKYNSNEEFRKKIIQGNVEYERKRLQYDEDFKLIKTLRSRLKKSLKLKDAKKCTSTMELIGCSVNFLKKYIGDQFKDGMTWENHGLWHIDHRKPCSSFNLTEEQQQKECFHYTNLQPLWAKDNLSKGSKDPIIWESLNNQVIE